MTDADQYIAEDLSTKSILDKFAVNWCSTNYIKTHSSFESLIVDDDIIERMALILQKPDKNTVILLGNAGVGKSAIVENIAYRIWKHKTAVSSKEELPFLPAFFLNKDIYSIHLNALISGTAYRGMLEARINKLLKELVRKPNAILFVDEFHTVHQTKKSSDISFVDALKPYLARNEIKLIGATTRKEFKEYCTTDSAFLRRLNVIDIKEPNHELLLKMLDTKARSLNLKCDEKVLNLIIESTNKYLPTQSQPDKSSDILNEIWVKSQSNNNQTLNKELIDRLDYAISKDIYTSFKPQEQEFLKKHKKRIKQALKVIAQKEINEKNRIELTQKIEQTKKPEAHSIFDVDFNCRTDYCDKIINKIINEDIYDGYLALANYDYNVLLKNQDILNKAISKAQISKPQTFKMNESTLEDLKTNDEEFNRFDHIGKIVSNYFPHIIELDKQQTNKYKDASSIEIVSLSAYNYLMPDSFFSLNVYNNVLRNNRDMIKTQHYSLLQESSTKDLQNITYYNSITKRINSTQLISDMHNVNIQHEIHLKKVLDEFLALSNSLNKIVEVDENMVFDRLFYKLKLPKYFLDPLKWKKIYEDLKQLNNKNDLTNDQWDKLLKAILNHFIGLEKNNVFYFDNYKNKNKKTYTKEISRILQANYIQINNLDELKTLNEELDAFGFCLVAIVDNFKSKNMGAELDVQTAFKQILFDPIKDHPSSIFIFINEDGSINERFLNKSIPIIFNDNEELTTNYIKSKLQDIKMQFSYKHFLIEFDENLIKHFKEIFGTKTSFNDFLQTNLSALIFNYIFDGTIKKDELFMFDANTLQDIENTKIKLIDKQKN